MKDVAEILVSTSYGGGLAANLIDENPNTYWLSQAPGPQEIRMKLTSPKKFTSYEMTAAMSGDVKGPERWVLQGSDNAVGWADLHVVSNQSAWSAGEKRVFTFENKVTYAYYRLNEIYSPGNNWVPLAEVNLLEPAVKALTTDDFKKYGMTDLSVIPESAWGELSENFKILVLTKDTSINSASVNVTAVPKRMLVIQETDMAFEKPIQSFTLGATVQNSSVLKVIASTDSGTTWKAFNGSAWSTVDKDNLSDVNAKGMNIATFNGITPEVWKPFLAGMKMRLAYYLDLAASTDSLVLDKLTYETVPVVAKSPKLSSIKVESDSLTIEGRLKDLERLNTINMAKLNFKSNALLQSEKYALHDMVVDTCDTDEMVTVSSGGSGELNQEFNFSNPVSLGAGTLSELSIASMTNIKKVEVK
ncbi:discoidin domain-containing protein [Bacillus mobilis]|uniref:discoidin domain-containing protein n=1 Tax=Bacillus mobilis TaxID=2026190 RepID=UPI00368C8A0F